MLLVFASTSPETLPELLLAALMAWGATFLVLLSSTYLIRFLTKRGLLAIERLMGMVIVALSVQLFLEAVSSYLQTNL